MKKMRVVSLLMSLLVCLTLVAPSAAALQTSSFELPKGTSVSARAAMVVYLGASAEQDTVVYAKGTDQKLAPGGMVRIMAGITAKALMAEKHLDLDTGTGTYTSACFAQITGTGIPTAGMETGDVWTLRDLLTMSLLQPAGDVVETLAFSLAGSEQAFVQRMNELASGEVGCTDTTFKNVTGLDASGQVSTAMDTYRILRYAMGDSDLEAMMALSYYTAKPKKGSGRALRRPRRAQGAARCWRRCCDACSTRKAYLGRLWSLRTRNSVPPGASLCWQGRGIWPGS